MSAFIVSNRTITRAIAALKYARLEYRFPQYETGGDKALGNYLYAMNAQAVAERYRERASEVEYVPEPALAFTKADALKGLTCLAYQCCEGRVIDSAGYKTLEEAERLLAGQIVSDLPEYRNAAWNSRADEPAPIAL
jgi:hypothetical protein